MASIAEVQDQVRSRYAAAAVAVSHGEAGGCGGGCCSGGSGSCGPAAALDQAEAFGSGLYTDGERGELPHEALLASLGCGNPVAVADLHPGETVLDLGSGGGIDVLLSARRVGPRGFAYGVDMTEEMLELARSNAVKAGAGNVAFVKGTIEDLPLPDGSVDVVISNCVINLSANKPRVLAEMFRVLKPGGRIGISDVVAEDQLSVAERAARGSYTGCIAGALSRREYLDGLAAAGFDHATVRFTHQVEPQMHAAIVQATKPAVSNLGAGIAPERAEAGGETAACCDDSTAAACCAAEAKASCCGTSETTGRPATCGCR